MITTCAALVAGTLSSCQSDYTSVLVTLEEGFSADTIQGYVAEKPSTLGQGSPQFEVPGEEVVSGGRLFTLSGSADGHGSKWTPSKAMCWSQRPESRFRSMGVRIASTSGAGCAQCPESCSAQYECTATQTLCGVPTGAPAMAGPTHPELISEQNVPDSIESGMVIENALFSGTNFRINESNVTLRNFRVELDDVSSALEGIFVNGSARDVILEDGEFVSSNANEKSTAIYADWDVTVRRVAFRAGGKGIVCGACQVEDSDFQT